MGDTIKGRGTDALLKSGRFRTGAHKVRRGLGGVAVRVLASNL